MLRLPGPNPGDAAAASAAEADALRSTITASLSLGQWASARLALRALHARQPASTVALLRVMAVHGPLPGWLASDTLPSASTLSWLAVGELRSLARHAILMPLFFAFPLGPAPDAGAA